jgi:hypothetical protein
MTEWLAGLLTYWLYATNNPISNCFWSYLNYRQIYLLFYLDFYVQTNIQVVFWGTGNISGAPKLLAKAFPSKVGKYVQNKK